MGSFPIVIIIIGHYQLLKLRIALPGMSLNEEEIQQLELLAILREHGKLTEDQFQLQTGAILRSSAVRRAPYHPLIQRIFRRKPKERKPLIPKPKKELILERHLLPDEIPRETDPQPAVLEAGSAKGQYADRERKPSLSTIVSMRTEKKQRGNSLLATLLTVTIAVLFTSMLTNSAPIESVIKRIEHSDEPTAIAMQHRTEEMKPSFVEPFFGPFAQRRCRSLCAGRNAQSQQYCFSSCSRLALGSYGRRITLAPLNPENEAKEMIYTCETKPLGTRKKLQKSQWKTLVNPQVIMFVDGAKNSLSRDFGSIRLRYEQTTILSNDFGAPIDATATERSFSENVVRVTCLRAHVSLAQLGLTVAHENNDSYSKRFYQKMYRVLRMDSQVREDEVIRSASELGVLNNE